MKKYTTTVTERGQVTLPAHIRRLLGVKPKEQVTFEVEGDEIRLIPTRYTVESVRGAVPAVSPHKSLDAMYQEAGEEYVRRTLDELNDNHA